MTFEDLKHVQMYFKDIEKKKSNYNWNKGIRYLLVDHCRHTTFMTKIEDVVIEEGKYNDVVKEAYDMYLQSRDYVYGKQIEIFV